MIVKDKKGRFVKGHAGYKYWLGKKLAPETVEKIRQSHLGKKLPPFTEEHKEMIRQAHLAKGRSVVKQCEYCNKEFRVGLSRSNARFCSVKCRSKVVMPPTSNRKGQTPWNKGKTRVSDERLNKMAIDRTGNKNWMYEHGKSKAHKTSWGTAIHKGWRKAVFERDNYTCQICFIRGGKLEADHIKCFAHHEELRYIVSNGRTLCVDCHKTTKNYGTHNMEDCNG